MVERLVRRGTRANDDAVAGALNPRMRVEWTSSRLEPGDAEAQGGLALIAREQALGDERVSETVRARQHRRHGAHGLHDARVHVLDAAGARSERGDAPEDTPDAAEWEHADRDRNDRIENAHVREHPPIGA